VSLFSLISKPLSLLILIALLVVCPYIQAANQGTVGASSSGNLDILVTATLYIVTFGFNDINLGTWSGAGDMTGDDNFCIARNGAGNSGVGYTVPVDYAVQVVGSGDGQMASGFGLTNGTHFLPFDAYFNDDDNLIGRVQLTAGTTLQPNTSSGYDNIANILNWNQSRGCVYRNIVGVQSGPNANISIVVHESDLLKITSGTYTGTLTLTVQPL
jgi:hypothetical protein